MPAPTRYAAKTKVTPEATRLEIERTLQRYGASGFGYMSTPDRASLMFILNGRNVRVSISMPAPVSPVDAIGRRRPADAAKTGHDQACRQRWRALYLVIRAKLEAIDAGISTVDEEFLANVVMPDGRTVGEHALPRVEQAYLTGGDALAPLLPAPCGPR